MRRTTLDRYPWAAGNLMNTFEEAKRRSLERARFSGAAYYPVPWHWQQAERATETFGEDFWPYGIEPNRTTLQAFVDYAHEQGVCHRKVEIAELFPKSLQGGKFKV